ncbi:MAG TPA: peroxidase-related enzyme [Thermoplasmata archaeon]|nr:peroxidase-related enzyme [Thermoplasmata archaeon]
MARIETKEVSGAEGPLGEAYREIAEKRGSVANVFRIESLNPSVMRSHLDFYMKIMYGKSGLSRREREMIAVVVSSTNGCTYCTTHHTEALTVHLKGEADPEAIRRDFRTASITAKERIMLGYAVKLTRLPDGVTDADVQKLRDAGLTDADVLDVTFTAAYFNFVNRLVLGLGVELEGDAERVYKY